VIRRVAGLLAALAALATVAVFFGGCARVIA
jgi:hypothetical protein